MPDIYDNPSLLREKLHELELEIVRLKEQKVASSEALIIARDSLQHNQEVSNEWRKENIDQRVLFVTKIESFGITNALDARVTILERDRNAVWVRALIIAGAIIGAVAAIQHFWK
jgi:hypothetical protein